MARHRVLRSSHDTPEARVSAGGSGVIGLERPIWRFAWTAAVWAALAMVFAQPTHAEGGMPGQPENASPVGRPQLRVGDSWTYARVDVWKKTAERIVRLEVTRVAGERIELAWASGAAKGKATWNQDLNVVKSGGAFQRFSFPLDVGKTWDSEYSVPRADGQGDTTWKWASRVVGREGIKVHAGSFDAIRIEAQGFWNAKLHDGNTYGGSGTQTLWYAPAVRGVVREESRTRNSAGSLDDQYDHELKEYRLAQ